MRNISPIGGGFALCLGMRNLYYGVGQNCKDSTRLLASLHHKPSLKGFSSRSLATAAASAEKEVYDKKIRHCNIATLGYRGHGKTTVASAITKILHEKNLCDDFKSIDDLDNHPNEKKDKMSIYASKLNYYTEKRHYALWDCPGHHLHMKNTIPMVMQSRGVIFVASATDDELSDTSEAILFMRNIGVKNLVVYVNKVDVAKTNIDDHVAMLKELLSGSGFDKPDLPFITGSALSALDEKDEDVGKQSILRLLNAVDEHIPVPDQSSSNKPFVASVDKTYLLKGLGTLVSATLEQGTIRKGMDAQLIGYGKQIPTKIASLERFGKIAEEASEGDHAFAVVSKVSREDAERGMVLCEPSACKLNDHCEAEINILTEEDGGRNLPLPHLFLSTMFCKTWDIPVMILTPEKNDINPGENSHVVLHLSQQMVMNVGSEFVLAYNNRLIGTGKVKKILPNLTEADKKSVKNEKKQKKKDKKA